MRQTTTSRGGGGGRRSSVRRWPWWTRAPGPAPAAVPPPRRRRRPDLHRRAPHLRLPRNPRASAGNRKGRSDPFDCVVCLCETAMDDALRLLPTSGHTFHVPCIDTWPMAAPTRPRERPVQGMAMRMRCPRRQIRSSR
ncbi:unnamed protein product [Triticum turgidum subsp. durum]|uniref:RING-type domain-containing protein n=1 Tax=Triticum turgidum subsp. durum TaxID=4567 RepID=A0A9R0YKA5_TRITD|nr:unnamed protein product [Triticum turgidum subsp. durum]